MRKAILHAFNWPFNEIISKLNEIKETGYTGILTSPITYSRGEAWFKRYQPLDLRIIRSPLGRKEDFCKLVNKAKELKIDIYVDIVINHMAHRNLVNKREDLKFPGLNERENYKEDNTFLDDKIFGDINVDLFDDSCFNPAVVITDNDYSDPNKIQNVRNRRIRDDRAPNGLPDLEPNIKVIDAQKKLLIELDNIGVKGFRVDAVKHVPVKHLNLLKEDPKLENKLFFSEVIPNDHYIFLDDVLNNTNTALYDFPLFYQIRYIFSYLGYDNNFYWGNSFKNLSKYENNPKIPKERAITFVNNHDLPNNEAMEKQLFCSLEDELLAYTYILGRDGGIPLIFSGVGYDYEGLYLADIRWRKLYKHTDIQNMLKFHKETFGRNMYFLTDNDNYIVVERDSKGFFAINKSNIPISVDVNFKTLNGKYCDLFSNKEVNIENNSCLLAIPKRSKMMFLARN